MMTIEKKLPGIMLCVILALPAWFSGYLFLLVGAPVFAILLRMVTGDFYNNRTQTTDGIVFTSRYILQAVVVLLGFGLNLTQVFKVGTQSSPIIISIIAVSLVIAFLLQKWLRLDNNIAILAGVGSSICGSLATAATAPVIKAENEEVTKSISVIFLFNILVALISPTLRDLLHLSNQGSAPLVGTAVNDTSSVMTTATAWDAVHGLNTLDGVTIMKLTCTLAIIPITLGLSFYEAYQDSKNGRVKQTTSQPKKAFPMFVLYFLLVSTVATIVNGLGIDTVIFDNPKTFPKFFTVMATGTIGLNTNPIKLTKTGGQAVGVGATCWIAITCVSLWMQHLLEIW